MARRHAARAGLTVLATGATVATALAAPPASASVAAPATPGFATPQYVDAQLAGGEPVLLRSTTTGRLVYSAHEGTTHLYRDGLTGSPSGDGDFATNYRNQVNIWYSDDHGVNWQRADFADTGFSTAPARNTGFSDPDLTQDAGGTVYDTGIDLANDAVFSSPNGGKDWTAGSINCHDGDRPWLAGGRPGEVFLATDTVEGGHQIFHSTDAAATCDQNGIPDQGTVHGASYTGDGKLRYDRHDGSLVEPILIDNGDGTVGLGVSTLPDASHAFAPKSDAHFTPHVAVPATTMKGHWPAIAIDRGDTTYLVWDTDPRQPGTTGGCGGAPTPLANSIKMTYSTDHGRTWAAPTTVAHPGTTVLWPWITAGDGGNVSVVWYQYDRVVDPDCATGGDVYVYDANIFGADSAHPAVHTVDASGRPIHRGDICQGGTTCVATGQDRRLGDLFTNALDARGCVLIATGDTMRTDPATGGPLPTARPLFIAQHAGRSLTGNDCAAPRG